MKKQLISTNYIKQKKQYNNENRIQKANLTLKKIYDSAERLVLKYGNENITVDRIVKDAGVAKGTFYVHFKSKDALYAEIIAQKTASADSDYQGFINALPADMTAAERLLALVGKIADELVDVIGFERMRTIYKALLSDAIKDNAMMGYGRQLYKTIETIVNLGLQSKEFRSESSSADLAKQILISFRGLTFEWCARYPNFDLKAQSLEHFTVMLDGLRA